VLCAPLHVGVPPGPRRIFTDTLVGLGAETVLDVPSQVPVPAGPGRWVVDGFEGLRVERLRALR
jgi:hypothetical protein